MRLILLITTALAACCFDTSSAADYNSSCIGPVQRDLLYNVDHYTASSVGLPGDPPPDELLSEAICCDVEYRNYAEPNGFYKFPDVKLFATVDDAAITTFYDVVCGVPVFRAPIDRSFADWVADTTEHGWPSFRSAEVIEDNVKVDNSTVDSGIIGVYSSCGTYLGSFLPDEKGDRYCIDLSCISGREQ